MAIWNKISPLRKVSIKIFMAPRVNAVNYFITEIILDGVKYSRRVWPRQKMLYHETFLDDKIILYTLMFSGFRYWEYPRWLNFMIEYHLMVKGIYGYFSGTLRSLSRTFLKIKFIHCMFSRWQIVVNWGKLPSVLFCARSLVCNFGFEGKINLWGAVGVSLFRVWLTWEETPCQVRDCCKYLCVERSHKESLCLQRDSFWYLSRCAVPSWLGRLLGGPFPIGELSCQLK